MLDLDWGVITGIVATLISVGGFSVTAWKTKKDANLGVTDKEQVERRDTVADRDALINQLQETVERLEGKVQRLETAVRDYQDELNDKREYIQDLRDHIYREKPPPPPAQWGATGQPV